MPLLNAATFTAAANDRMLERLEAKYPAFGGSATSTIVSARNDRVMLVATSPTAGGKRRQGADTSQRRAEEPQL